jgi:hypothetical protein
MTMRALYIDNFENSLIIKRLSESESGGVRRVSALFTVVRWGLLGLSRPCYNVHTGIIGSREQGLRCCESTIGRVAIFACVPDAG